MNHDLCYLYRFFLAHKREIELRGDQIIIADEGGQYCFSSVLLTGGYFDFFKAYAVNRS
jgi:hypothetical protein